MRYESLSSWNVSVEISTFEIDDAVSFDSGSLGWGSAVSGERPFRNALLVLKDLAKSLELIPVEVYMMLVPAEMRDPNISRRRSEETPELVLWTDEELRIARWASRVKETTGRGIVKSIYLALRLDLGR